LKGKNMAMVSFEEYLTPRERQVVELIVDGYSAKEIGKMLSISPRTVEAHRWNICRKLRARNTADIVRIALEARMAKQSRPGFDLAAQTAAQAIDPLEDGEGLFFADSSHIEWKEAAPGVFVKILYSDKKRNYSTKIVRMDPGARYPKHLHRDTEELFMLEGDFHVAGRILSPGDYHRAETRSIHNETRTKSGCKFLLLSSDLDILLD
jgi:DNA-binding CsgD family transcriptional regulator